MAKRKTCSGCGYVTDDDSPKCPICGGNMENRSVSYNPHNSKAEKELNGGYHNDFEEGRKTGDYCDREFEKNINGGMHIHNSEESSHTEASSTDDFNIGGKHIYEMDKKEILTIQAIASIFPVLGILCLIMLIKKLDEYQMDEDIKQGVIKTYVAVKFAEGILMALSH